MATKRRSTSREKLLGSALGRAHRYHAYRAATQGLTLVMLYLVPVTGLARYDLWDGRHATLGRPAGAFEGFVATAVGIAAFYLVTFLLNLCFGRIFCGWGCPLAQVSRFGERLECARRASTGLAAAALRALGFDLALALGVLLWWVHPAVFIAGDAVAMTSALLGLAGLAALFWVHGRYWRWSFCQKACPIGLYYSVVNLETTHGIVFDDRARTCKDCHVCALVCPVGLDPRDLAAARTGIGGLAIDGLPASSHCLSCGDCVAACEHVFRREPAARVPLRFGFGRRGRPLASTPVAPSDVTGSARPEHSEHCACKS